MRSAMLFTLLVGAVATDLTKHKIYNLWVLPGFAAGMAAAYALGGSGGMRSALLSALSIFLLLFPVYLAGGIGAGDVKLFAAAAVFLGYREAMLSVFLSFLVGGACSIIRIAVKRSLHQTIRFAVPILVSVLFIFGGKL